MRSFWSLYFSENIFSVSKLAVLFLFFQCSKCFWFLRSHVPLPSPTNLPKRSVSTDAEFVMTMSCMITSVSAGVSPLHRLVADDRPRQEDKTKSQAYCGMWMASNIRCGVCQMHLQQILGWGNGRLHLSHPKIRNGKELIKDMSTRSFDVFVTSMNSVWVTEGHSLKNTSLWSAWAPRGTRWNLECQNEYPYRNQNPKC